MRADAQPANSDSTQLAARDVRIHFDGVKAVDGVDLSLGRREILGLIGPNGAGKTTLVNGLSGFQRPTSGDVFLRGERVTDWPPHRLARSGVSRTFQSGRFFHRLSVRENVEVGAVGLGLSRRAARQRVSRALELMGLSGKRETDAASLSHGQERRLGIARALAMDPSFLLLDEPAAGLDVYESEQLVKTIAGLPERLSCGVLVIEHDMHVVMSLCERVQVIDYGKTISVGTPDEVRSDPAVIDAYLGASLGASHAAG